MKYILLIITIFNSIIGFSQMNQNYVDSLTQIIKKGIPQGDNKKTILRQVSYISACEALGDYYYKSSNIKKALNYYLLVANLGDHTDSELWDNEVPIKLRDKVCLKVGDIYFYGRGIKKDLDKALHYHTKGLLENNNDQADHYSKLYFNSTDPIFILDENKSNDSIIKFAVNTLDILKPIESIKLKKYLHSVKVILNSDTSLNCLLLVNTPPNEIWQMYLGRFLEKIKKSIVKNISHTDRVSSNMQVSPEPCVYKFFSLPCFQIIISKSKLFN